MGRFFRKPSELPGGDAVSRPPDAEPTWRVLLVEDCPDHQRRLLHVLPEAGAAVTLECNVKAGFDRAASKDVAASRFDLIVTDLRVPFPDGVELARKLRLEGCMVPIVMVSAQADPTLMRRALDAGCDRFLARSTGDEEMLAHFRSLATPALQA